MDRLPRELAPPNAGLNLLDLSRSTPTRRLVRWRGCDLSSMDRRTPQELTRRRFPGGNGGVDRRAEHWKRRDTQVTGLSPVSVPAPKGLGATIVSRSRLSTSRDSATRAIRRPTGCLTIPWPTTRTHRSTRHMFEPHFDRHMWIYRDNPAGVFTPLNPAVSCENHRRATNHANTHGSP